MLASLVISGTGWAACDPGCAACDPGCAAGVQDKCYSGHARVTSAMPRTAACSNNSLMVAAGAQDLCQGRLFRGAPGEAVCRLGRPAGRLSRQHADPQGCPARAPGQRRELCGQHGQAGCSPGCHSCSLCSHRRCSGPSGCLRGQAAAAAADGRDSGALPAGRGTISCHLITVQATRLTGLM